MDTIVVYNLKKVINISLAFCLFLLLTACPGEEDCFDMGSTTRIDDLIKLLPEQTEYNQGDVVTLSLTIPATNSYFGNELNLFQETGDELARLNLGFNYLFIDNEVNSIIGNEAEFINRYYMPYNSENDTYELILEITLNKVGNYSFVTDDSIEFIGNGCDRYIIDTNILWQGDAIIEFIVN